MSKYAGVRHKPGQSVIYWFEIPEHLAPMVTMNSQVLCNTSRGQADGTVVAIIDGCKQNEAKKIIGNHFPLKKIIAVKTSLDIDKIHIPFDMQAYGGDLDDIYGTIEAYCAIGYFPRAVKFSVNNDLIQGYSEYLVAKMFDHCTLEGYYVSE